MAQLTTLRSHEVTRGHMWGHMWGHMSDHMRSFSLRPQMKVNKVHFWGRFKPYEITLSRDILVLSPLRSSKFIWDHLGSFWLFQGHEFIMSRKLWPPFYDLQNFRWLLTNKITPLVLVTEVVGRVATIITNNVTLVNSVLLIWKSTGCHVVLCNIE